MWRNAMQTDVLIIGQGISGTFLSWWLERAGVSFLVIDEERPFTASKAAAGLINPVTGRRMVKTWMIDELLPFAQDSYVAFGRDLDISCIEQKEVVDFFPMPQMRHAFYDRLAEDPQYLRAPENEQAWNDYFNYPFGYGLIGPCWLVDLPGLLGAWRKKLKERSQLLEERFDPGALIVEDAASCIRYNDIRAQRIIFCDGVESAAGNWFSLLPFAPNKGEALILEIPGLPKDAVFKKGISLLPWQHGLFWAGSSYEWSFKDAGPTEIFRQRTEAALKEWLKLPFKILDHFASVRPATLERRPFVGFHPRHPAIGILNGMGTKGCSLAPYFAQQLAENIISDTPILPEADVQRFRKVLGRG